MSDGLHNNQNISGNLGAELQPAFVASELVETAHALAEPGSALAEIGHILEQGDLSQTTAKELFYEVSGWLHEHDAGSGRVDYDAKDDRLTESDINLAQQIRGQVANIGRQEYSPVVEHNFGLGQGQMVAVLEASDHTANNTGSTTDWLYIFPTRQGLHTLRFRKTTDSDYKTTMQVLSGMPVVPEDSASTLIFYLPSRDKNLRDSASGLPLIYRP